MSKPPAAPPPAAPVAPKRPATANDVAQLAGVSRSAVSRAFTTGASVSEETRKRVAAAAERLGYRPNLIARSLITRRSNMIGVAMGYLQNQFYPEMLEALSARASEQGYRILLFSVDPTGHADPILDEILRYRVDALVLASASLSSHLAEECRAAGVPVVLVNRKTDDANVASVTGDNHGGARKLAAFLAAAGHRRFGYISGLENSSTSRDREAGFTGWLAEQGLGAPVRAVGDYQFEGAVRATRELLSRAERPDALFCANDHMALAAIETARSEFGLAIGREISIVGFDNVGAAAWPSFRLTTFSQPIATIVAEVLATVQALIDDPMSPPRQTVARGELVVRASARAPTAGLVERDGVMFWRPGEAP